METPGGHRPDTNVNVVTTPEHKWTHPPLEARLSIFLYLTYASANKQGTSSQCHITMSPSLVDLGY